MRYSRKPIHKCYTCLLNQGDHCWGYRYPRLQWHRHRVCPGFENELAYRQFRFWQKQANVKSRKDLRREALEKETPEPVAHLEGVEMERAPARLGRPAGGAA